VRPKAPTMPPPSSPCATLGCHNEAPAGWTCDACEKPLCVPCDEKRAGLCGRCFDMAAAYRAGVPAQERHA
jgi:hypothetical protein